MGASVSSNAMNAQVRGERLVRPNQLLPTVLLVLGTAGVRKEVGTNNHHNSFPPPRWVSTQLLGHGELLNVL